MSASRYYSGRYRKTYPCGMIDVSELHCPDSIVPKGKPGSRHNLTPRRVGTLANGEDACVKVCTMCGMSEPTLLGQARIATREGTLTLK